MDIIARRDMSDIDMRRRDMSEMQSTLKFHSGLQTSELQTCNINQKVSSEIGRLNNMCADLLQARAQLQAQLLAWPEV